MAQSTMIRAATAQFHIGTDSDTNLATCLRALDHARKEKPHIIVLPEFCNHLSWYDDQAHCRAVSVEIDSPFLKAISQKARDIGAYVVVNVTLNRAPTVTTATSLLYGPNGQLLADNDKQILIGHENGFLTKATRAGPLTRTPFGLLGLYACMDGVINEPPRGLALRGARFLCNSLNSFARDEASLHVPVRASENKVFVIAANKVGPLVPEDMVDAIAQATGIPAHFLEGAGESQIVGPDGSVLAIAPKHGEAIIFAQFDAAQADHKSRPDGTHIFGARRPALYHPIASDPATQITPHCAPPDEVQAALIHANSAAAAFRLIRQAFEADAKIIALAPLEGIEVDDLARLCPIDGYIAFSEARGDTILVAATGIALRQAPLHTTGRFGPARADKFETITTPFGRIALVAGDDGIFPEAFRLLALTGAHIAIAPVTPLETWELNTGLLERAAENRVNLLAPASGPQMGFAAALQSDFTIMTPWASRAFDGLLSHPIVTRATNPLTPVTLYPASAANKVVSRNTDLLAGRPWALAHDIVRPT
jgi:nitrilase